MIPLLLFALSSGQQIFDGKGGCRACHSIDGLGGSVGPDLTIVGIMRTPKSLRLALTDPGAEIYREYLTAVVTTSRGLRAEGIVLNEDDLSIQLRDAQGNPRSFLKKDLKSVQREERSLMPSYRSKLTPSEIDSLVEYLRGLRGTSPPRPGHRREIAKVTENFAWMNRPERDGDERPEYLLDALEIVPGATVADVGAGTGYFTSRISRRVGSNGKVIAVDLQQSLLDSIAGRRLANVEVRLGTPRDPNLPESALDLALMANSYHEFEDPEAMLAAVRRALKPDGRLVIVEYKKEDPSIPVSTLHRMSSLELRSEVESAGFQLERILDFLPIQHGMIFSAKSRQQ